MGRFRNNPSIGLLHPKFTHDHPLAWANKKLTCKPINLSIQPTFDSPSPIRVEKVFPQCLGKIEPIKNPIQCHPMSGCLYLSILSI